MDIVPVICNPLDNSLFIWSTSPTWLAYFSFLFFHLNLIWTFNKHTNEISIYNMLPIRLDRLWLWRNAKTLSNYLYGTILLHLVHLNHFAVPSPEELCAVSPKFTRLPDKEYCQTYFDCGDKTGEPVKKECSYPLQFDVEKQSCEDFHTVKCGNRKNLKSKCKYGNFFIAIVD